VVGDTAFQLFLAEGAHVGIARLGVGMGETCRVVQVEVGAIPKAVVVTAVELTPRMSMESASALCKAAYELFGESVYVTAELLARDDVVERAGELRMAV